MNTTHEETEALIETKMKKILNEPTGEYKTLTFKFKTFEYFFY